MIKKYKNLNENDKQKMINSLLILLLDLNFADKDSYNELMNIKHKLSTFEYDIVLLNLLEKRIEEMTNNENWGFWNIISI